MFKGSWAGHSQRLTSRCRGLLRHTEAQRYTPRHIDTHTQNTKRYTQRHKARSREFRLSLGIEPRSFYYI
eukprot:8272256-Alexandrium_andersonii.AAC.1